MLWKRSVAMLGVGLVLSVAHPGRAQSPERYRVRLTTVPMDGGMRATVAGSGSATAILTDTRLTITGTFTGLRSPATDAHLYRGPVRGVRGSAIGDLTVEKAVRGTLSGSIELTPQQTRDLREGRLYVQMSSEKAPEGNLWGWLLR